MLDAVAELCTGGCCGQIWGWEGQGRGLPEPDGVLYSKGEVNDSNDVERKKEEGEIK